MRECRYVLSAFRTEGNHVAETLVGLTQPNLEETDEAPGFRSVIVGLDRNVKAALGRLITADRELMLAVAQESLLRQVHQSQSEQQGLAIVALRRLVIGQFLKPDLENLGLQPVDVRDPVTVARRSQAIGDHFAAPNLAQFLGEARLAGEVDFGPGVDQIRASAEELLALGEQINEATRLTARLRVEKGVRQSEHDALLLRSARVLEDFCRIAGDIKLAEKIRNSVRSRPSVADGENEPDEGDPDEGEPGDVIDPIDDVAATDSSGEDVSQEV